MMLALLALLFAGEGKRTYWPTSIQDLIAGRSVRTHVQVEGWATYIKKEADGDIHIRLCDAASVEGMDRARCIVAECTQLLPCSAPKRGLHLRVKGISRFDSEHGHGWLEVHPVEYLETIP